MRSSRSRGQAGHPKDNRNDCKAQETIIGVGKDQFACMHYICDCNLREVVGYAACQSFPLLFSAKKSSQFL